MAGNMIATRLVFLVSILGIFCSSPTRGLLAPGNIVLEARLRSSSSHLYILKHEQHTQPAPRSGNGVQPLRAAASDDEEAGGGFVNPYTAFRKWQKGIVSGEKKSWLAQSLRGCFHVVILHMNERPAAQQHAILAMFLILSLEQSIARISQSNRY